jgi:hypothetical protein
MAVDHIRPAMPAELHDPFDRDEQAVSALVTVGAFMALADGRIDPAERDAAVDYVVGQRLAPSISRPRMAAFFDARARHLGDRDFAASIADALRTVAALALTFDVVRIAELVAAADRRVNSDEAQMIALIRLVTKTAPERRLVQPAAQASEH